MKITIEYPGKKYCAEISNDSMVQDAMQAFCFMLLAAGYSQSAIVALFNDPFDGENTNNPFNWEIN